MENINRSSDVTSSYVNRRQQSPISNSSISKARASFSATNTNAAPELPNVVGLSRLDAINAVMIAGFNYLITYVGNAGGANSSNNDKVHSASLNGSMVEIQVYQYQQSQSNTYIGIGYDMSSEGMDMSTTGYYMYLGASDPIPVEGSFINITGDSLSSNNGVARVGATVLHSANGTDVGTNYYSNPSVARRTKLIPEDGMMDSSMSVSTPGTWVRMPDVTEFTINMMSGYGPVGVPHDVNGNLQLVMETSSMSNNTVAAKLLSNTISPAGNGFAGAVVQIINPGGYMGEDLSGIAGAHLITASSVSDFSFMGMSTQKRITLTLNSQAVITGYNGDNSPSYQIGSGEINFIFE
jgi:hypothetical protein